MRYVYSNEQQILICRLIPALEAERPKKGQEMAKKQESESSATKECRDCKSRNNVSADRRTGDGGCGWCSVTKKYVARREQACAEFKARVKQVCRAKNVVEVETPAENTDTAEKSQGAEETKDA